MRTMTECEAAWTAGYFEGEGSLSIRNVGDRPWIQLSLTSTDDDVLERFVETVGAGRIYGPYRLREPNVKPQRQWRAHGWETLQRLRDEWWPWLGERRRARFDEVLAQRPPKYVQINRATRRFTDDQVRDMRASYANGETQVSIGARYGVVQAHVSQIILGKYYREVA